MVQTHIRDGFLSDLQSISQNIQLFNTLSDYRNIVSSSNTTTYITVTGLDRVMLQVEIFKESE